MAQFGETVDFTCRCWAWNPGLCAFEASALLPGLEHRIFTLRFQLPQVLCPWVGLKEVQKGSRAAGAVWCGTVIVDWCVSPGHGTQGPTHAGQALYL